MSMKGSTKKAIGIVLLILLPIVYLVLGFSGSYRASCLRPDPPRPEITYGEFPFRIEYEINGEMVIVEDTIICEFDGFQPDWGGGDKTRKWKVSFASGKKSQIYKDRADLLVDEANHIYFALGDGEYYMGDDHYAGNLPADYVPSLLAYKATKQLFGGWHTINIGAHELLNTYGIKIISYEIAPPIVNSFK